MSRLDVTLDPKVVTARRVEVITGGGGRRRWSDDEKARAIEASLAPGAVVSEVARAHGVTPQQLFGWRREARRKAAEATEGLPFVRAIVETPVAGLGQRTRPTRHLEFATNLERHIPNRARASRWVFVQKDSRTGRETASRPCAEWMRCLRRCCETFVVHPSTADPDITLARTAGFRSKRRTCCSRTRTSRRRRTGFGRRDHEDDRDCRCS